MKITITNVSNPAVAIWVSDLYVTIQPGASVTTTRALSQLSEMASLQSYISAGQLKLVVDATTTEINSGTLAPLPPLFMAQEWDAPPAASATAIMPSTATVVGSVTYVPQAGLTPVAGVLTNPTSLGVAARNLTFTGGGTTGNCPTSAVIIGDRKSVV